MQIKSLSELDSKFLAHKPSVPAVVSTPKPEKSKVISKPDRVPINKQSALILRPVRSWILQPLAEPPPAMVLQRDVDEVKAQLKAERNEHASTRDDLGNTRARLQAVMDDNRKLREEVTALKRTIVEKDGIIRQLEDIKL